MSGYHYQISEASRLLAVEAHVLRYWEEELGMIIPRNEMGHRYYTEDHLRIFSQIKDMKERGYQLRAIRAILSGEEAAEAVQQPYPAENREEVSCQVTEIPVKKEPSEKDRTGSSPDFSEGNISAVKNLAGGSYNGSKEYGGKQVSIGCQNDCVTEGTQAVGQMYVGMGLSAENEMQLHNREEVEDSQDEKMHRFQAVMTHIVAQAMLCNNSGLAREISRKVEEHLLPELEVLLKASENRQEERFRKLDEAMRMIQQNNRARYEAAASRSPFLFGRRKKKRSMRRI